MHDAVAAKEFVRAYERYASLAGTLGLTVDESRLLRRVAGERQDREQLAQVLGAHRVQELNGQRVSRQAVERMQKLCEGLAGQLERDVRRLSGTTGEEVAGDVGKTLELLAELPETRRDELADRLLLNGHRDLFKPRYISVEEFQELLRQFARDQTVARQRLICHLRKEFKRRGIDMSCDTIEERFRAKPAVRTMPYCVKQIFRNLGDEFRTGLIPIEHMVGDEGPEQWLRRVQRVLRFRSQSAMHKAISQATGVSYDSIHKALSGKRKAKRIQAQVKACLDDWLEKAVRGEPLDIDDEHRGVPVEEMCALMPPLLNAFGTKEAVYRALAKATGVRPGSIRRYFQNDGLLRFAPLSVYRTAREMADKMPAAAQQVCPMPPRAGRTTIGRIAKKAEQALHRWRRRKEDPELEREFKDLRRALIIKLQERRRSLGSIPLAGVH